ncbi:Tenascin-X-like, partial [Scleropages formosus]
SCPNNCRDRGRCVNGKCECDTGFTGPDCSTKSCPNDCSDRGRCVNGKCVCNVGFMGQDCSLKSCPANCNNRGRCVKAKCVCHAGFTGSDCGQCEAGFTGPDCSTALPGVTQLSTRDLTDSSVTIFWTQPSMQYDIYHITFTSKKEGDQRVTSTVEGWLSTYTQTGLAAGQEYTVTIQGEKDGVMGQETTIVFRTLISGPKDLRVVKTTTTTAVVQWEPPLGDIDRYRLFISPGQTNGTVSRTLTLPPGRDSAHVKGLEAGRLYNISLVAQRGRSQSQPITVQIIPGNMTKAITKKIPKKVSREKAPEMDKTEVKPTGKKKPDGTIFYKKEEGKREGLDSIKEGYNSETQTESSVKPGLKRPQVKDKKVLSKPSDKVIPPKKPKVPGQAWYNGTRTGLADLNGTLRETGLKPKTVPSGYDSSQDVTSGGTQASKVPTYSKVSASGQSNRSTSATKQPSPGLSSVSVQNITSRGFVLIWDAPEGMFKNFIVSRYEFATENRNETNKEDEQMPKPGLSQTPDEEAGDPATVIKNKSKPDSYRKSISGGSRNDTASPSEPNHGPRLKVRGPQKFSQVIPGTARSLQFQNLRPQTRYSVSLFGMGPRIRSKMHQLKIETGPEPPSDLKFSNVTDSSFYVSWIKPRRPVTGFKVTFAHMKDGEPISLSLNSHQSSVPLSALSPGSSYEVSVISTQGMDESDPVKGVVVTAVDQYIIVYGSEKGSDVMITMSGNAAEQQLKDLQGSTLYTVTVSSQLGNQRSRGSTTRFTTTSGSVDRVEGPRDLIASQVTPRSAVLTWKPPTHTLASYKLTYQTAGQEMTEVTLDGSATQHKLKRLQPKSKYTVRLQGERQGEYSVAISTDFTTGTLAFPFPTDCSQELMNGVHDSYEVEVFPNGPQGQSALVYCDMETDGGGWTVIQRRMDGKTNFFRGWREYSAGFGNISGEFWIGNELLHNLTRMTPMALRIDLRSGSESVFAHYSSFSVDTQKNHYAIQVSGYSGTAGDSMKYHNGRPFSTRDRDPNPFITRCAVSYRGGWWYKNCHEANLNGLYDTHTNHQGIIWTEWKGKDFSIPFTEMKIRPSSFTPSTQG